jgi:plasmid maintenance system antidote protein VapI
LIKGELIIDNELAAKLAKVLGGTKKFWLTRESQYRKKLSKRNKKN